MLGFQGYFFVWGVTVGSSQDGSHPMNLGHSLGGNIEKWPSLPMQAALEISVKVFKFPTHLRYFHSNSCAISKYRWGSLSNNFQHAPQYLPTLLIPHCIPMGSKLARLQGTSDNTRIMRWALPNPMARHVAFFWGLPYRDVWLVAILGKIRRILGYHNMQDEFATLYWLHYP